MSRFREFSGNLVEKVRLFGENLFSDRAAPSEEPTPAPPPEPKSVEIARRWSFVLRHVNLRIPVDGSSNEAHKRFDQTMSSIAALFDVVLIRQDGLSKRREKIEQKIEAVVSNCSAPSSVRSIRLVSLDLQDELCELEESYFSDIREELLHVMNFVAELQKEHPTGEIEVKINDFFEKVNGFPSTHPAATKLTRQIEQLKGHRPTAKMESLKPKRSVRECLDLVFAQCAPLYDSKLTYFPDVGPIGVEFLAALDELSPSFHKRMRHRITRCIAEPNRAGLILLDQCADLSKRRGLEEPALQVYLFLLFTRLYFSEIYLKSIVPVSAVTLDFQSRVYHLRQLAPVGFGFAEKYLQPMLMTLRLVDFKAHNEYEEAVGLFGEMSFVLCPIDFCMKAMRALEIIQEVASTIAFSGYMKRTKQLVAKSDYSLSHDDLFEIALIVWLISDPIDTITLVTEFEPFINGLQLPAVMNWAFALMRGMCDFVMGLDIKEFVCQAKQRLLREQEIDPLHILAP